jgi:hypothetical protein
MHSLHLMAYERKRQMTLSTSQAVCRLIADVSVPGRPLVSLALCG